MARPAPRPKQEVVPNVIRNVLSVVTKAEDLEVHMCKATMNGVTVLDVRDYVPSTGLYGRGTTLPWNTESLKLVQAGAKAAERETRG